MVLAALSESNFGRLVKKLSKNSFFFTYHIKTDETLIKLCQTESFVLCPKLLYLLYTLIRFLKTKLTF